MNEQKTMNPTKWSRNATVANFGAAGFNVFSAIFMWQTHITGGNFGIIPPPIFWTPIFAQASAGKLYATVLVGGVLAVLGGVLARKKRFYAGAIIVTLLSFILAGGFFSLLALAFLLAAKGEFARKVRWKL